MPANIIPTTWCDPREDRGAERAVFEALAEQLEQSYTIFHDRAWVGDRPSQRARLIQCDFIICHEELGIIVLEVKGGRRIRCQNGRWQGLRHDGTWFSYAISPHQQAFEAVFSLRNLMKDATASQFPNYVIAHAVCFPQADVQQGDLDKTLDRAIVIDRRDMANLEAALLRARDYWRKERMLRRATKTAWLPASAITEIQHKIARDIDIRALLGTSITIEQQDSIRLSEEQANILYTTTRARRLAVAGCAGSGKTLLALLIARRLAGDGKSVLLCCFNRPLRDHLRGILDCTPAGQSVRTATLHELCFALANQLHTSFDAADVNSGLQAIRDEIAKRIRATWSRYDAVVIDEGQDFDANWWPVIEALLVAPDKACLFVFYDDNQRVYQRNPGMPTGIHTLPLTVNFRTTRSIHREIIGFYRGDITPRPAASQGENPQFRVYIEADPESIRLQLQHLLAQLQQSRVPPEWIVILTPRAESDTSLPAWETTLGLTHTPQSGLILWDTVYRFKGLERSVVILVEVDHNAIARSVIDQLLYVAYSRASNRLFVLHSNEVSQETIRRIEGMPRPVAASVVDALDDYQLKAVKSGLGHALVWAGAGSGKTRVLTRRVAYLLSHFAIEPEQILAVTFTNKAANEMKERLRAMLGDEQVAALTVGTFHATCAQILREEIRRLPGQQFYGRRIGFRVLDSDEAEKYFEKAIGKLQLKPEQLKVYINEQKNSGVLPHECIVETELERRKVDAYESYEQLLRKDNRVDFNDMLLLTVRLLEQHEDVRSRLHRRYRHILVDEYQDTNIIQARIIKLLATSDDPETADDAPHSLMVVGDAQQSIYLWRQAKYTLFTNFATYYPDVDVHPLKINYRSTRRIIEVALTIADPQFTGVDRLDMIPHRRDAALEIEALELEDVAAEAREIARRIREVLDSGRYTPRQIVVLLRSLKGDNSINATIRQLEIAFHEQRIPSVTQGVQSFYRNTIIHTLVRLLRAVCAPDDDIVMEEFLSTKLVPDIGQRSIESLHAIRKNQRKQTLWELLTAKTADMLGHESWLLETLPSANLGHSRLIRLREATATILDLRMRLPRRPSFKDFLFYLRTRTRFDEVFRTDSNDEEFGSLMEVFQQVLDSEVSESQDLPSMLDVFAIYDTAHDDATGQGQVRIMSIHRSKGLEFPMVFVPALEEGTLPDRRSFDDKEKLLEEGRVCYVALTRAMDELILSCVQYRSVGPRKSSESPLQPSRYFRAILQQVVEARQALQDWDNQESTQPPDYDRHIDAQAYQTSPATIIIDATTAVIDNTKWVQLNQALSSIPGAYPAQLLICDDDGHVVIQDIDGGICGHESTLRWLRRMSGLAIFRQEMARLSSQRE